VSIFNDPKSPYVQQVTQAQRHEIARIRQLISEFEWHLRDLHQRATVIGRTMQTQEDSIKYANLLLELNRTSEALNSHYQSLNQMMQMANFSFGKTIPDQCRREIYHLYHAGRYTQAQLASQYQISQSAVNKIVNGPVPAPIEGVNPNGVASS
jgi:hypothetical protein